MSTTNVRLDSPAVVIETLATIERELAERQNSFERAAEGWFAARREQARDYAIALLKSQEPSVTAQKAEADLAAYMTLGAEHEAEYESMRAVLKMYETRATICMSILKAQGHAMSP